MLTCPHSLDHIPRWLRNHPCLLRVRHQVFVLSRQQENAYYWNMTKTKLNSLFFIVVFDRDLQWRKVCVPTSAGVNECVQSILAGQGVIKTWNRADKWNYTQTIKRSVKSSWHEFTLRENREGKHLFASEHQSHSLKGFTHLYSDNWMWKDSLPSWG